MNDPNKAADYIDTQSGLLHCGICHAPKECRVRVIGRERVVRCACTCQMAQWNAEEAERLQRERLMHIRRLKATALQDKALWAYTFDNDDGSNPAMRYAHRYAENWSALKNKGKGLLLWGNVGTGKTFAAACIAHSVTEQGYPVLMTNFGKILNSLSGMFSEDKNRYLASLNEFDLLIIDDLGVERSSEYALEQVYNVVDSRYLSCLPFIITTNLSLAELKKPRDLAHARIYDRILERCVPVCFTAKNYRLENRAANQDDAIPLLSQTYENQKQQKEENE